MSDTRKKKPRKTLKARYVKAFRPTVRFNSFDTDAWLGICTKLKGELETMKQ